MIMLLFVLAIAGLVFALFRWRRSNMIFVLALLLWFALPFYNQWILSRCSGDCNIRVDLLLVAPLMLIASGFALFEAVRRWRGRST
jgi:hypothetical protein